MEALNSLGLTPISVLSDRRTEPRKIPSISVFPVKLPNSANLSIKLPSLPESLSKKLSLNGGLVLLSSVLNAGVARALTYEEALEQSMSTSKSGGDSDSGLNSVISFGTENPAVVFGGVAALAIFLVLSQVTKKPTTFGVRSARNAYAKLGEDENAQLLDIRKPSEFRLVGTPDIRGLQKKPVCVLYKGEDKQGFLEKLALKFKEPEKTTLYILDKFDGNSELVAELLTVNGFKAAYAIKGGAEGPQGWMKSGVPWTASRRALSFDFSNVTETISGALGEAPDGSSLIVGLAAATGLGLLAFAEVETVLQLVGSVALIQFISKKLLFAEDRTKTLKEVDDFLNNKVAPKEFVEEIKEIGKVLLPSPVYNMELPVPKMASLDSAAGNNTVQKAEAVPEPKTENVPEQKAEAVAGAIPEINSIPKPEVKAESLSGHSRPLSPYPYYPDYKPPTSPSPSQP